MSKALNQSTINKHKKELSYPRFKKINGEHPFQKECPNSCVLYRARKRHGGKVAYFNFDLAKELGLISKDHPSELSAQLEAQILETFSIVIINEYDEINNIQFRKEDILPNKYMATRYLQLQHPNKQGKTSGDGRSIWNGQVTHKGITWDISSCGTGATRLSPATHIKNKFFQTGDPSISYGCGYSEKDEGLSTLFFSEIMNKNGLRTERCLGIIEFNGGISINIRAHENLLRPSHMFNHLKQANYPELKSVVDFFINRQIENGQWKNVPEKEGERYSYFLEKQTEVFAKLAADFESNYIFCWLDWDGDNILMDGGIIDYGSIRQFGLFHHEYRYDDVQRFSTTIKEQKEKAKHIVLSFEQIVDFLKKKKKSRSDCFKGSRNQKRFDQIFKLRKEENLLLKIGLERDHVDFMMNKNKKLVEKFMKPYSYFERAKSVEGLQKVADGINWSAIFCMRDLLRELPQIYLSRSQAVSAEEFIEIGRSNYATDEDIALSPYREKVVADFQRLYSSILDKVSIHFKIPFSELLLKVMMRSSIINKYDRVTGDSITTIVNKVMKQRPKLSPEQLHTLIHDFSDYQDFNPDDKRTPHSVKNQSSLMKGMLKIVRDYREGI